MLLHDLDTQTETCRQGGGEKGIARHVKLNKKVKGLYSNLEV